MTLAILTIIDFVLAGVFCFLMEGAVATYWPFLVLQGIMSIVWLVALISPSEQSRKITLLTWIIFVAVGHIYYLVTIINGSAFEPWCNEDALKEVNSTLTTPVTVEDCKANAQTGGYINCAVSLLFGIYFATVIARWSKNDEGWERA